MINIGVFNINTNITTKLIYSICDYSRNASLEVMVYTDNKDVQIVGHNNVHKITDYNNNIFDCVVCHNVYALSFKNKPEQIISTKDISYKKILNEFLEKNTPNRRVNEENLDDNDNESLDDSDNDDDNTSSQVEPHTTTQLEKQTPSSRNVRNATNNVTNNNTVTPKKTNVRVTPKDTFRDMCNDNLYRLKNKKIPKIKKGLNNEAVLVEFRVLPHLEVLIRNAIYNLGDSWSYTVICGNDNYNSIQTICKNIHSNIKIIRQKKGNITQNEYNNMLMTTDFWDLLVGEKILLYQEDTLIFNSNIQNFMDYDYVGAPFHGDCVKPINIGNGGLTLRTRSIMKEILRRCNPSDFKTHSTIVSNYKRWSKLILYPEDVYFAQTMQNLGVGKVCPYDVARNFSSEQVFTDGCFGAHCLWICNINWQDYINKYFAGIGSPEQPPSTKIPPPKKVSRKVTQQKSVEPKVDEIKPAENKPKRVGKEHTIDVYFVHCHAFKDRTIYVDKIKSTLNKNNTNLTFEIYPSIGIDTRSCALDYESVKNTLFKQDKKLKMDNNFEFYKSGQIGAYLSHYSIMQKIQLNSHKRGYSIIFEDDVSLNSNFINDLNETLIDIDENKIDFDIIYLGYLNNKPKLVENEGKRVKTSNIYEVNKRRQLFGAHALLINNKKARLIATLNNTITGEVDIHYKNLINENKLKGFYLKPSIVNTVTTQTNYINL